MKDSSLNNISHLWMSDWSFGCLKLRLVKAYGHQLFYLSFSTTFLMKIVCTNNAFNNMYA